MKDKAIDVQMENLSIAPEIECFLPDEVEREELLGTLNKRRDDDAHRSRSEEDWTSAGDGSIQAEYGFWGIEVRPSEYFTGHDVLGKVHLAYERLNGAGARVNGSCGAHIHIGIGGKTIPKYGRSGERRPSFGRFGRRASLLSDEQMKWVAKRAVYIMTKIENGIFGYCGGKRKQSEYCAPAKNLLLDLESGGQPSSDTRNSTISLNKVRQNTIEFRIFSSTMRWDLAVSNILTAAKIMLMAADEAVNIKEIPRINGCSNIDLVDQLHRILWGKRPVSAVRVLINPQRKIAECRDYMELDPVDAQQSEWERVDMFGKMPK